MSRKTVRFQVPAPGPRPAAGAEPAPGVDPLGAWVAGAGEAVTSDAPDDPFSFARKSGTRGGGHAARPALGTAAAFARNGGALVMGAQAVVEAWSDLAREGFRTNLDALDRLSRCRTPLDLFAVQHDWARDGLGQALAAGGRLARISAEVADAAGRAIAPASRPRPGPASPE